MSRRHAAQRREVLPDPKFGDKVVSKFMNCLMEEGKKSAAEQIVYGALDIIQKKAGKDPLEVEQKLLKFTPPEFLMNAHHWLILHGRYVCLARRPKCPECAIRDLCDFRGKTKAGDV